MDVDVRVAIRTAMVAKLEAALVGPAAATLNYRPTRAPIALPAVTFRDSGFRPDDIVPLDDRTVDIDVWTAGDLDAAEAIAHAVNAALDHQPIALPGDEGLVCHLALARDSDEPQEDADLVRKTLSYRLLAYEFNGPQPFGET